MKRKYALFGSGVIAVCLVLAACAAPATPAATPSLPPSAPTSEPIDTPEPLVIPFEAEWAGSGHNDAAAEAFIHWDEDDPAEVPLACAKCHSAGGYADFLGIDGSPAGVVDRPAETGTTITCVVCHNQATLVMDSVVMPSGAEIVGLGREARCMQCHQGRESTISVNARIETAGVEDDVVSTELGFANIHYYAAAATKYGTFAQGGYEYEGKSYDGNFAHVEEFDTCVECHDPHTLQVRFEACTTCHPDAGTLEDLSNLRMPGSLVDFDGDGNLEEGIGDEISGLQGLLLNALQAYGVEVAGAGIVYDSQAYPYFFIDSDGDGTVSGDEAGFGNRYASWTPRLLRAAYNYQVSRKDPGAFAHGGKYIIQLLADSIEDLNLALSTPATAAGARIDHGHFAGSEEAFRHWDEDGSVPASCARCHTASGLPTFLTEGVNISAPLANGFQCTTCHNDLSSFSLYEVPTVRFPSGARVDSGDPRMNLCMTCHQGRESTVSVDAAIAAAAVGDDTASPSLGFRNIHYFAAGATVFGTEAQGAYEFAGNRYLGRFTHLEAYDSCVECHSAHQLSVQAEACFGCHTQAAGDLRAIRISSVDYDGDGEAAEGLSGEIDTMAAALYNGLQNYAKDVLEAPVVYDSHAYPYFFNDTDGDGVSAGPGEANFGNRYATWSPSFLRAAYNYQYSQKDPGAFAHNGKYLIQILFDSLREIGASTAGMTRP